MSLIDMPAGQYHSARGLYMTSHRMIAARRSVADFIEDARKPSADTTAYYFGRAAHVYTLEGREKFHTEYVVGGPINPKTGRTYGATSKRFRDWAATQKLPAITAEEYDLIRRMDKSVRRRSAANQLLANGHAERTGRFEIAGVPCQVRLDWMTYDDRIVDYKTTSDLSTIAVDADHYGYAIQQAFYRQGVERILGKKMPCYLIWCEKSTEAPSVVWRLNDDLLDAEAAANEQKIVELKEVFFKLAKETKRCQSEPLSKTSPQKRGPRPRSPKAPAGSTI